MPICPQEAAQAQQRGRETRWGTRPRKEGGERGWQGRLHLAAAVTTSRSEAGAGLGEAVQTSQARVTGPSPTAPALGSGSPERTGRAAASPHSPVRPRVCVGRGGVGVGSAASSRFFL